MTHDLGGGPVAERSRGHVAVSSVFEDAGEVTDEVPDAPQRAARHHGGQLIAGEGSNERVDAIVRRSIGVGLFFDGGHGDNVHATPELFNGSRSGASASGRLPAFDSARIHPVNGIPQSSERSSLRGPEAQRIGGRFWFGTGAILLIVFAVAITVSFISAAHDNSRIERLKTNGVPVVVTVTSCVGNIGGSGSNASGYTCRGAYRVKGVSYQEIIGSKSTLSSVGSTVQGIADPERPSTIELASAVARSSTSPSAYVVASVLAILFVALTLLFLRRLRTSRGLPPKSRVPADIPSTS